MNVKVNVQVGLRGALKKAGTMSLPAASVGITSSWAGSYHVLSMEQHYDAYVVTNRTLTFPPIAGFPVAHPYQRLTAKIRAAAVTGNIGECVAALFATDVLKAAIGDILLIAPRTRYRHRKSPDYVMRLRAHMPGPFSSILPAKKTFGWPKAWPVESKARKSNTEAKSAKRQALRQIIAYWSAIVNTQPQDVGYGMIVSFSYASPAGVTSTLLVPSDQGQLKKALLKSGERITNELIKATLYGC